MKIHRYTIWALLLFLLITGFSPTIPAGAFTGPESIMGFTSHRTQNLYTGRDRDTLVALSSSDTPFAFQSMFKEAESRNIHFSMTRRTDPIFWHASMWNRGGDLHTAMGGVMNHVTFLAHYGDGEGTLSARQGIDGISPNFFHGSVADPYEYSGVTVNYEWSGDLAFHAGTLRIEASGHDDRSVYSGGFGYKGFKGTLSTVLRGGETAGHRIAAGYRWQFFKIGYQALVSGTSAHWHELGLAYAGKDTIGSLRLNIGAGRNDRYEDLTETRITLTYSIPLGGDKKTEPAGKTWAGRPW